MTGITYRSGDRRLLVAVIQRDLEGLRAEVVREKIRKPIIMMDNFKVGDHVRWISYPGV